MTELMTPSEVAKKLGLGRDLIIQHITSGRLIARNLSSGGKRAAYFCSEDDVQDWLDSLKTSAPPPIVKKKRRNKTKQYV